MVLRLRPSLATQTGRAILSVMIRPQDLLRETERGLWCEPGGFFIDPMRPADRAVVTHGHADHARAGHTAVAATPETLAIMAARYGEDFCATRRPLAYGERMKIGDVMVSLHPAGHVLGSAQARLEWKGLVITVSGDYKRRRDPTCALFEPVPSHVFVSEATFGLPVFRHPDDAGEMQRCSTACGAIPSAPTWSAPMRWARRSASSACCASGLSRADLYPRRAQGAVRAL
jgi:putative mRNA 3-end processing factor